MGGARTLPVATLAAGTLVVGGLVWFALSGGGSGGRPRAIDPATGASGDGAATADPSMQPGATAPTESADPGDTPADARAWATRLEPFEREHRAAIERSLLALTVDGAVLLDVDATLLADLAAFLAGARVPLDVLREHAIRGEPDVRIHALMLASFALHSHADAAVDDALLANFEARLAESADASTRTFALGLARATGEVFAARRARSQAVALVTRLGLLTQSAAWREHEDAIRAAVCHVVAHHPGPFDAEQRDDLSAAVASLRIDTLLMAWHAMLARSRDAHTLDALRVGAGYGLGNVGDGLRRPTEAERDLLLRALAADGAGQVEPPPEERLAERPFDRGAAERARVDSASRQRERLLDRERALEGLVHLGRGVLASATAPSVDPARSTRDELVAALARYGAAEGLEGLCELAPLFTTAEGVEPILASAMRRSLAWYVWHPALTTRRAEAFQLVDDAGARSNVPEGWRRAP